MDPLTHACVGYCLTRATRIAKGPGTAAMAALVATLPDLDLLLQAYLAPGPAFAFHRGPLHSIPCGLLGGLLLAPLVARATATSLRRAAALGMVALSSHGLLDFLTGYGTALLWPLSDRRFSLELLFVVDPLITLPLLLAATLDLIGPRGWRDQADRAAAAALAFALFYTTCAGIVRGVVTSEFRSQLRDGGIEVQAIHAEPTPSNIMLWYLCADDGERYHILYRSIWDGADWEHPRHLPVNREPLQARADDPVARRMLNLFQGWFTCLPRDDGGLDVIDVRLGRRYGWTEADAPFSFTYQLSGDPDIPIVYHLSTPPHDFNQPLILGLIQRIFGVIPQQLQAPSPGDLHAED
jgi:inner membrane protein